jgi:hypothetical protein
VLIYLIQLIQKPPFVCLQGGPIFCAVKLLFDLTARCSAAFSSYNDYTAACWYFELVQFAVTLFLVAIVILLPAASVSQVPSWYPRRPANKPSPLALANLNP